ncbi:MAG: SDR family oxidoreductase [Chloroflexi bacterium]|nr:SDR family oxidoreductase [Chloroflexota bacterium]
MAQQHLAGQVAVVTGGGRGLGRAIALKLAAEGAKVVVNDLGAELDGTGTSREFADGVAAEIKQQGGQAVANYNDISKYEQARDVIESAVKQFGRIDILVNSVGNARPKLLVDCTQEDFDILIDVMLKGKLYTTQHAAKRMVDQRSGRIVNLGSNIGLIHMTRRTAYAAAQVGIFGFSRVAASELGPYGVTVNSLSPGATESRLIRDAMRVSKEHQNHPILDAAEKGTAFLTPAPPDNLANVTAYLCTKEAANINGQIIYVAGGHLAIAETWLLSKSVYKDGVWGVDELIQAVPKTMAAGLANPAPKRM